MCFRGVCSSPLLDVSRIEVSDPTANRCTSYLGENTYTRSLTGNRLREKKRGLIVWMGTERICLTYIFLRV